MTNAAPSVERFVLRPEIETDRDFRFALFRTSRGAAWDQVTLPPEMLSMIMRQQFDAQTLGHAASYPEARLEIVTVDGAPVGRLAVDRAQGAIHLIDIALMADWRGRGLGSSLLRRLMDEAARAGRPLTLHVAHDNIAAHRLYLRLGFAAAGEDETHLAMTWTAPADRA